MRDVALIPNGPPDRNSGSNTVGKTLQVFVRDNNVEQALKVLKRKMQREGVFREMKRRKAYEKPSERKTREKAEAIRRVRKAARKQAQRDGLIPVHAVLLRGPCRSEISAQTRWTAAAFSALATRKRGDRKAPCQWSWSTAISSTSSTTRRLSFAFLIRMKALVSASPSDVARKSVT